MYFCYFTWETSLDLLFFFYKHQEAQIDDNLHLMITIITGLWKGQTVVEFIYKENEKEKKMV